MVTDELLDLVDERDNVIGSELRSHVYAKKMNNFRVVNAFLMNDAGQLWIPRRSAQKRVFPLCLDTSMGGHVESGESYADAFRREMLEELRIDIAQHAHTLCGSLNPIKHGTSAFEQVYLLRTNAVPSYNPDDFVEYFWLTPDELFSRLENGDKAKSDLPIIVRALVAQDFLMKLKNPS